MTDWRNMPHEEMRKELAARSARGTKLRHNMIRYLYSKGVDLNKIGRKNSDLKKCIGELRNISIFPLKEDSDRQMEILLEGLKLPSVPVSAYQKKQKILLNGKIEHFDAKKIVAELVSRPRLARHQPKVLQADINEFYDSWEWKRLSYDVKKRDGRKCKCCGRTPEDGARIITDHIKPLRFYWDLRLDPKNLQVLCDDCNRGKGSRDQTDWRSPA